MTPEVSKLQQLAIPEHGVRNLQRLKVTRLPELASLELEAEAVENGEQLEVISGPSWSLRRRLQVAGECDAGRVELRARSLAGGEQWGWVRQVIRRERVADDGDAGREVLRARGGVGAGP